MEQESLANNMVIKTMRESPDNLTEKKKPKLSIYLVLFFVLIILGVGGYWYYSKVRVL